MPGVVKMRLLERDLELGTAGAWLDRVEERRGGRLLVEGPAGIGKSALLETLVEEARRRGMRCLVGQASEVTSRIAFGVARAAFGGSWPESRDRTVRDAARIALELAERQPLLVAIDDVQWADPASLRWLRLLAERAVSAPVGLVLAARTGAGGAAGAELDELLDDRTAIVVRPAPLSLAAAAELVGTRLGGAVEEALATVCHAQTGGNPYLLLALADALRQAGVPEGPELEAGVRQIGARAVSRSVGRRLERLQPPARRLIEAVAVVGDVGGLPELAAVAELTGSEAAEAARRLLELDLLAAGTFEIAHPLIGEAVRAEVGSERRRGLLHRAARRLREAGKVEDAAARLADLQPRGDPAVAGELAEAAGLAAGRGAPDVAAALLRRALAEPPPAAARAAMQATLGRVLLAGGDLGALEVLDRALADTPPGEAASVAAALAQALNYARRTGEAAAVLDRARAGLGPEQAAAAEELEAMAAHYLGFDPARRAERARRLARWGDRRGASELAYRMRLAELSADAIVRPAPAPETVSLSERALAGGTLLSREFSGFAKATLALAYGGRPAAARVHLRDGAALARRRGDTVTLGFTLALQGETRRLEGEMAAVESDVRTGFGLMPGGELGPRFILRGLIESLVEQGRVDEAEEELRAGELAGELPPVMPTPGLLHARALVRIAAGAVALGLEDLFRAGELAERLRLRDPLSVPWRLTAAEALISLGDRSRAGELLVEHLRLAREKELPEVLGPALRVRAALGGDEAGRDLARAVELLDGGFARLELARALVDLGAARRRTDRAAAREVLERAARIADELAARPLAARARDLLGRTGAPAAAADPADPATLDDTELTVARLSAEGLSNREIGETLVLSERTVESELAAASRKLAARAGSVQVRPPRDRDDLSRRELEVLRMLATPLSMGEVAAELYVTRNTLKTHCRSLYRKLEVGSREEAVARGRTVGLLP